MAGQSCFLAAVCGLGDQWPLFAMCVWGDRDRCARGGGGGESALSSSVTSQMRLRSARFKDRRMRLHRV